MWRGRADERTGDCHSGNSSGIEAGRSVRASFHGAVGGCIGACGRDCRSLGGGARPAPAASGGLHSNLFN